jgi:hypothetical protein
MTFDIASCAVMESLAMAWFGVRPQQSLRKPGRRAAGF